MSNMSTDSKIHKLINRIQSLWPAKKAAHTFILSKSWIHTAQLEDIPDLIHRIQSFLPAKEAARTCILSKSWLHAWSTIPTLRFPPQFQKSVTDEQKRKYQEVIDHTLQRYYRDNLSIECLDIELHIQNQESAFKAEKWIQPIVSKNCLKELSLKIRGLKDSFTLPNELFSSENLCTINIIDMATYPIRICRNPLIKCVALRVLDLQYVNVTEEVFHNLLCTCTFLEKIKLLRCKGLKKVMVKNMCHLRELVISSVLLEIKDVPSLRLFDYHAIYSGKPVPFKVDSLGSVTQLDIGGVIMDDAFLDIIKSKFPLLVSLRLGIDNYGHESLVITSVSLQSLSLSLYEDDRQVNVEVHAPKLLYFFYYGGVHGLLFPTIAPNYISLTYVLSRPLDHLFFLKLMEVLNSSSEFSISIKEQSPIVPLKINIDDIRRRCLLPVTNVRKLCLQKSSNTNIQFFDAFFSIFHPRYIVSPKLVIREMMERQPTELKDVELINPYNRKRETLTSSSTSVLDALTDYSGLVECKLYWVSHASTRLESIIQRFNAFFPFCCLSD